MRTALSFASLLLAGLASAGEVSFAAKPTARRDGDKTVISFAVGRETDVAVYVENAKGEVVRHLVAGVLGKNPPEPLKANSLEQSVEWDGLDDDGKRAEGGPFKARVGLGLRASYAGQSFAEKGQTGPNKIENVLGLAAGPDGRVYVLSDCSGWVWGTTAVHVFRRDGGYEKTIKPFPANLPVERAAAAGAFLNSFGGLNPLIYRPLGLSFYPFEDVAAQPAVTADGQLVLAVVPGTGVDRGSVAHLAAIAGDGGIPNATYAGPPLGARTVFAQYPFLAAAPDSKAIYLTGVGPQSGKPTHAVYRVALPERGPAEVWFGDPGQSGGGKTLLNDPRGLAADGQGHLLVADYGNNRVVSLDAKARSFAGEFPVPAPNWLAVHPRTGAVYVQSGDAVVKFSGWRDTKEQARLELPGKPDKRGRWVLALEASAEPAVLWAARGAQLLRCEDQGAKFAEPVPADCYPATRFRRPAADPTRREVACKFPDGPYSSTLRILNEETGQVRALGKGVAGGEATAIGGRAHRLDRNGFIYAQDDGFMAGGVIRFDPQGKMVPFAATADYPGPKRGRLPAGFTGTTWWERDFSVDRKGDIYVKARGPEYHGLMTVEVYDQQGRLKRTALWTVSDGMYGPRLDPKGNLYVMEAVKPFGQPFPEEFKDRLRGPNADEWFDWIYGSIVKFSPDGGAIWFSGRQLSPVDYEGWWLASAISDFKTTGGCLTGSFAGAPPTLNFPRGLAVDAATHSKISFRLKNDSDGTQATLSFHPAQGESYIAACGPGAVRKIDIKPNGDFAEYTFDLAGDKDWTKSLERFTLSPTNAKKGSFSIDWVRIGDAGSKLVWNFNAEDSPDKKLPAGMKKEKVGAYKRKDGAILQGALWWRPGFSPVGDMGPAGGGHHCHCTASDFDVDDFGRTFAPDAARFRVGVLDTNGNEILSFGGYGNQDCCGPESYVVDPTTRLLRPRKADDPPDLASPFAKPDVAFGWIVGLAVTDRYAYVDDVINKRVLRVKLDYALAESVAAP